MRPTLDVDASNAASFFASATTNPASALAEARNFLTTGLFGEVPDPYTAASFVRNRVAPPRLALLTEGLSPTDPAPPALTTIRAVAPVAIDSTVHPPVVTGLLRGGPAPTIRPVIRTSAPAGTAPSSIGAASSSAAALVRAPVPTVAMVAQGLDPALGAHLTRSAPAPQPSTTVAATAVAATAVAATAVAATAVAGSPAPATTAPATTALVASDGGAASQRAGTPAEALRQAGTDPQASSLLTAQEQAIVGAGASLLPGDVLVTTLPNHELDMDRQAPRPSLAVTGTAAVRVVAISGTGEVLSDSTVASGSVPVPWHTARLVTWCIGGTGAPAAGLAGWAATDRLPWVGAGVTLAAGSVVTGFPAPDRAFRAADAAWVSAGTAASQATVVTTYLPSNTTAVVVTVDASADADLAQFSLGLSGATRPTQADGTAAPPVLVASAGRAYLVYDVVPRETGPVVISVGSGPSWRLAGALGGPADAATTANQIAAGGAGNLVVPLLSAPTGLATVRWVPPAPVPVDKPSPTPAPGGTS